MLQQPEALDRARWESLLARLGTRGAGISIWNRLTSSYGNPARAYHSAEHILDCLGQFDLSRHLAQRPDEVEAALWFHDAIYIPTRSDNEERSAQLARESLSALGMRPETARRIGELVRATTHDSVPSEPDAQLVCDIDLSILGRSQDRFDEFERRIRREYAWVAEPEYRAARSEVLRQFLGRDFIYQTGYFRARYERQARVNLERVLERLSLRLEKGE